MGFLEKWGGSSQRARAVLFARELHKTTVHSLIQGLLHASLFFFAQQNALKWGILSINQMPKTLYPSLWKVCSWECREQNLTLYLLLSQGNFNFILWAGQKMEWCTQYISDIVCDFMLNARQHRSLVHRPLKSRHPLSSFSQERKAKKKRISDIKTIS